MKMLRLPTVLESTGLSRATIYDMMARGKFPKPVKIGERANGWPEEEVAAWRAARVAERDEAA